MGYFCDDMKWPYGDAHPVITTTDGEAVYMKDENGDEVWNTES